MNGWAGAENCWDRRWRSNALRRGGYAVKSGGYAVNDDAVALIGEAARRDAVALVRAEKQEKRRELRGYEKAGR